MPSISLGGFRALSVLVVAFRGVMAEISVASFGLPAPPDSLAHSWDRFYSPYPQGGANVAILATRRGTHGPPRRGLNTLRQHR